MAAARSRGPVLPKIRQVRAVVLPVSRRGDESRGDRDHAEAHRVEISRPTWYDVVSAAHGRASGSQGRPRRRQAETLPGCERGQKSKEAPMAELIVEGPELVVRCWCLEKLAAPRANVRVPLRAVRSAAAIRSAAGI